MRGMTAFLLLCVVILVESIVCCAIGVHSGYRQGYLAGLAAARTAAASVESSPASVMHGGPITTTGVIPKASSYIVDWHEDPTRAEPYADAPRFVSITPGVVVLRDWTRLGATTLRAPVAMTPEDFVALVLQ